jgi:hypothetical protein
MAELNRIDKTLTLTATNGEVIFYSDDTDDRVDRLDPSFTSNFIEIVSRDGGGAPVNPTVGTYDVYAQLVPDGNFRALADGGTIQADTTGGSALADGLGTSSSFVGNPIAIKIVATGVDVATQATVTISQNSVS